MLFVILIQLCKLIGQIGIKTHLNTEKPYKSYQLKTSKQNENPFSRSITLFFKLKYFIFIFKASYFIARELNRFTLNLNSYNEYI